MRAEFETTPGRLEPVDWQAVEATIARARRLRAEAMAGRLRLVAQVAGRFAMRLVEGLFGTRRQRADTRALMALDDRMLADIGLSRDDIKAAIYGGAPLRAVRQHTVEAAAEVHTLPVRDRRAGSVQPPFERAA